MVLVVMSFLFVLLTIAIMRVPEQEPLEKEFNFEDVESMYRKYFPKMKDWAFVLGTTCVKQAEDMAHDIFLKLLERPHLIERMSSTEGYLFRMAKNHLLDEYARHGARKKSLQSFKDSFSAASSAPADPAVFGDISKAYEQAIALLPERQREAYVLWALAGLSTASIAEKMSVSPSTAKQSLRVARLKIEAHMAAHR